MADLLVDALRDIVGATNVLTDSDMRAGYETDWLNQWHGETPCVVRPGTTDEVARALRVCAGAGATVVTQGGNTGLVGGSVPLACADPGRVRNSSLVYDDKGKLVARYDKIHLFGFEMGAEAYHEERTIEAGVTPVTTDTPFGKLGLSICYDLRFPELYRSMQGVDIIFVPSAFTETTGRAHWETLLRARAIENLAFVVAAAQGGRHENGRETHGDSMIVDPWGVVLDRLPRGAGVVIADIDLARMHDLRRSLPALQHRVIR